MESRHRLRNSRDFEQMRQQGRTFSRPSLLLTVRANGLDHNRYGFVVGKRLGTAVTRNRIRRRLREAMRRLHPQLRPGYDVVVIARPPVVNAAFSSILDALKDALGQAKLKDAQERGAEE